MGQQCIKQNILPLATANTAWKTIFSFSGRPEKMVFPKNCPGIWSFLYYRERRYYFFPKIWSYPLDGKWKMIFLKKVHGNMIFSSNVLKRWSFQKDCPGTWSFLYFLERWYFFPENVIFFLWAENERWSFSRNTWKYDIFSVPCPSTKKIKDNLIPQKYT